MKQALRIFLIIAFVLCMATSAFAVANTCTSTTAVAAGSDPNFTVTYKAKSSTGLILYVNYTKGAEAGITLTFDKLNSSLSATDLYRHTTPLTSTVLSLSFTATGKYRIPLPIISSETKLVVNVTFGSGNTGGAAILNVLEP